MLGGLDARTVAGYRVELNDPLSPVDLLPTSGLIATVVYSATVREGAHGQNARNHLNTHRNEPVDRNTSSGFLLRFGIQRRKSKGPAIRLTL